MATLAINFRLTPYGIMLTYVYKHDASVDGASNRPTAAYDENGAGLVGCELWLSCSQLLNSFSSGQLEPEIGQSIGLLKVGQVKSDG